MALTDNLNLCMEFESGAITTDATGTVSAFTNNNTVLSVAGKVNNAGSFVSATSQSLSHADVAALKTGNVTWSVAAWLNLTDTSASHFAFCKDDLSNPREYDFGYTTGAGGTFFIEAFAAGDTGKVLNATTFGTPTIATYYFVVGSYNSSDNKLRISVNDGTVDSLSSVTPQATSVAAVYIGSRSDGSVYFNGLIDQLLFYKRDLFAIPADITSLYNAGNGLSYAQMVAGRTTKNTRAWPLGTEIGMGWRMPI